MKVVKKEILANGEIEIAVASDAMDRIEDHWLEQIDISSHDYIYIKREANHLIIGKAEIDFIE